MTQRFQALRVAATRREIGGRALTVDFDVAGQLSKAFAWRPGQHVTLRFWLNAQEVQRRYSISSSPFTGDPLRIIVKRVPSGLVSNHIVQHMSAGDWVDVMPPSGRFCLDPGRALRRTHYFFGAGAGITPLFAMLRSVLLAEPASFAVLVYCNASERTILCKDELSRLADAFPGRLIVKHVLSKPRSDSTLVPWRRGRIDKAAIEAAINENPPYAQDVQYYSCGPGDMNRMVRTALMSLDVPSSRIHVESFGGAIDVEDPVLSVDAKAVAVLNGRKQSLHVARGQTLLEAMRAAGLSPPYSCQSGVCGACRARLDDGTVHLRAHMALDQLEIESGAILACQAVPTSRRISIAFP